MNEPCTNNIVQTLERSYRLSVLGCQKHIPEDTYVKIGNTIGFVLVTKPPH